MCVVGGGGGGGGGNLKLHQSSLPVPGGSPRMQLLPSILSAS